MMTTDLDEAHSGITAALESGDLQRITIATAVCVRWILRHLRAPSQPEPVKAAEAGPSDEELRDLEQRASKTPDGWAATGSQRRRALYDAGYLAAQQSASVAGDSRVAKAYEMGVKDGKSRLAEWERKVVEAAKRWRDCAKFGISPVQADRELIEAVDALDEAAKVDAGGGGK